MFRQTKILTFDNQITKNCIRLMLIIRIQLAIITQKFSARNFVGISMQKSLADAEIRFAHAE